MHRIDHESCHFRGATSLGLRSKFDAGIGEGIRRQGEHARIKRRTANKHVGSIVKENRLRMMGVATTIMDVAAALACGAEARWVVSGAR